MKWPEGDMQAVDAIATLLGTNSEWSSAADFLEDIANIVGAVRPHPGDAAENYRAWFKEATGRDLPDDWVGDEGD